MKNENIIANIKYGQTNDQFNKSGYELARYLADKNAGKTGNKTVVRRILDSADVFNDERREFYSFDVVEVCGDC